MRNEKCNKRIAVLEEEKDRVIMKNEKCNAVLEEEKDRMIAQNEKFLLLNETVTFLQTERVKENAIFNDNISSLETESNTVPFLNKNISSLEKEEVLTENLSRSNARKKNCVMFLLSEFNGLPLSSGNILCVHMLNSPV